MIINKIKQTGGGGVIGGGTYSSRIPSGSKWQGGMGIDKIDFTQNSFWLFTTVALKFLLIILVITNNKCNGIL